MMRVVGAVWLQAIRITLMEKCGTERHSVENHVTEICLPFLPSIG